MAYPTGYTLGQAVYMVQSRTNYRFGQPIASDIVGFLNAALQQIERDLGQVITVAPIPITQANTSQLQLPADMQNVLDVTYSTGDPSKPGVSVYSLDEIPYSEFMDLTQQVPAGGPGGIPDVYCIVSDSAGVQTIQVYPIVSSGQMNVRYAQRPVQYDPNNQNSTTTLDTAYQESMILYACSLTCESQENDARADRYMKMYTDELQDASTAVRRRQKKRNAGMVRDVTSDIGSVVPFWMA